MDVKKYWLWGFPGLALLGVGLYGQEPLRPVPRSAGDSLKLTSLGFERVLNTFLWNGKLVYGGTSGGVSFNTIQSVRSRLIRSDQKSIQDEYNATLHAAASLSELWRLQTRIATNVLADNKLVDLSQLAQHQALVGAEYGRPHRLAIGAFGGYEYNAQGDERDGGFSYLVQMRGKDVRMEDFRTDLLAKTAQSFLTPRRQRDDSLVVNLGRDFGTDAQNSLSVRFSNQRREFYTAADSGVQKQFNVQSNIFRREAQLLDVENRLSYRTSDNVLLTLRGGVSNRTIDRGFRYKDFSTTAGAVLDTRVHESQLFGSLDVAYRILERVQGQFEIIYREREERHEVIDAGAPLTLVQRQESGARRLGNVSRQTILRSQQKMDISSRDQLNLVGSASILRYDTPDTLNTDDRDELLLTFGIEETHTASRYLRVTLSADAVLNHLVYLHRLQSANNNWNRVIRFSPKVEYTPAAWLKTVNTAEVLANYTVYDFEDQVALVQSFSLRQASWSDSTTLQASETLGLAFVGTLRIYERGILRWKEFKERPQNYFVEQTYWPQLTVRLGDRLLMAVGYRYFGQDRYKYVSGERVFERRLQTGGPTAMLQWEAPASHRLSIQGWREQQEEDGKAIRTISNLDVKLILAL